MKDERKPFNVADFVSNKKTPVETRDGRDVLIGNIHRIINDFCVCGNIIGDKPNAWLKDGHCYKDRNDDADLFFSRTRPMTNKELAWWLMEKPEEHREWKKIFDGKTATVHSKYVYLENDQDKECDDEILIRSNGGEWRFPEVKVKVSETKTEVEDKVKLIPHKTRVKVEFDWGRYSTILKIQSVDDVRDGSIITLEGGADLEFFLPKGKKTQQVFRKMFGEKDNYIEVRKETFTILD